MLSRSISTALTGKGKARASSVLSSSNVLLLQSASSTPSHLQAGTSSRAPYTTVQQASSNLSCTCRPRVLRYNVEAQLGYGQKARVHASATSRQQSIPEIADLSMREYHEIADRTMDQLTDTLEAIQEELGDDDFDVEYSSGVLTVKLPADNGTYVINKQPPNKQIWLSSPTSGPKRYDYSTGDAHWFYTRDGSFLINLLEEELSEKLGTKVSFETLHH